LKFENIGFEGKVVEFSLLEHIMDSIRFVRAGQWDYERITYDFKFEDMTTGSVYYLRVPCAAVEGVVEQPHAQIKLGSAYVGKHYYPHGVEYDEEFPSNIVNTCKQKLNQLYEEIQKS
jgi:hypothetical protein